MLIKRRKGMGIVDPTPHPWSQQLDLHRQSTVPLLLRQPRLASAICRGTEFHPVLFINFNTL